MKIQQKEEEQSIANQMRHPLAWISRSCPSQDRAKTAPGKDSRKHFGEGGGKPGESEPNRTHPRHTGKNKQKETATNPKTPNSSNKRKEPHSTTKRKPHGKHRGNRPTETGTTKEGESRCTTESHEPKHTIQNNAQLN